MRKALVTGAAGFIGSNVVRALLEDGVEVRALIKPGESLYNLDGLDVERVEGDVLDSWSLAKAVQGCDTLFHLAAIYKLWTQAPRQLYEVNIRGSNYILLAARDAGVERIIFTSSIAAIGLETGRALACEETPFNLFRHKVDYILTKYVSQMNALDMAAFGLPVIVVNPAVPFGPGDIAPTPSGKMVVDIVNGNFPGYIDAGLMAVDVRDVARGHVLAAKRGKIGEKYILGNQNLSLRDFVLQVARITEVKTRLVRIPKALMFVYGWAAERISNRFTHRDPRITYAIARTSTEYAYYDNRKAKTELGLTFRPLEETLRDAIEWFRERGVIQRK